MKRNDLALRLTRALHRSEDSIDAALDDATALVQEMLAGRKAVGLSVVVGAEACEAVTAAVGLMGTARARMIEAHKALSAAAPQIGVRDVTHLMGPGQTKPDAAGVRPSALASSETAA